MLLGWGFRLLTARGSVGFLLLTRGSVLESLHRLFRSRLLRICFSRWSLPVLAEVVDDHDVAA
jgi:hypothetical protein